MTGVDTNVLVRLFIGDDPAQYEAAKRLIARHTADDPIHVNIVVVVELVWALNRVYKRPSHDIRAALLALTESANVSIDYMDVVRDALSLNKATGADIADVLIAGVNSRNGHRRTITFDKLAAKRVPGMELLV